MGLKEEGDNLLNGNQFEEAIEKRIGGGNAVSPLDSKEGGS